jgi:hypothetical protein
MEPADFDGFIAAAAPCANIARQAHAGKPEVFAPAARKARRNEGTG